MKTRFTTQHISGGALSLHAKILDYLNALPVDHVVVSIVPTQHNAAETMCVEVIVDTMNPLVDSSDRALGIGK